MIEQIFNGPTISSFVEAMVLVTVRSKYSNFMPKVLETDGGIDDQSFCPTNA